MKHDPRHVELATRLTAVLESYKDISATDLCSCAVGWAVGLTMRTFAWSPERTSEEVLTLARSIVREYARTEGGVRTAKDVEEDGC